VNLAKAWILWGALGAWAQAPEIARNGVVNAASNTPSELVDSAIAQGSLVTLRGARFGTHLEDLSAKLSGPAGEAALAIVSISPSAATARVPAKAPLGPASLTITVNGHTSPPYPVKVVPAQFGIYANNGKGWGPGRIQNVAGNQRTPNTVANAAAFGQTLSLSGTGLGDGKKLAVMVGGRPSKVVTARAAPEGDEILFQIPANAPEGCFVPVQVLNAGRLPSNTVTVAIHKTGGACTEPEYFPFAGWPGASFGIVALTRTVQREGRVRPVTDEAGAWFGTLPNLDRLNPYFLLPPPGTCTSQVETWQGELVPGSFIPMLASHTGAKALRVGDEISIDDGRTVRKVPAFRGVQGVHRRELSDLMGRADRLFNFLSPVVVHVAGKGGADVGRFSFALPGTLPFDLRGTMEPVQRSHSLRLEWTDMGADRIAILFANFVDSATGSRGMCYCSATPGATDFTIPAAALAYFPSAGRGVRATITVAAWPLRLVTFRAAGLDHAVAVSAFMNAETGSGDAILQQR